MFPGVIVLSLSNFPEISFVFRVPNMTYDILIYQYPSHVDILKYYKHHAILDSMDGVVSKLISALRFGPIFSMQGFVVQ